MRRIAARRAAAVLASDIEEFERLGYRPLERSGTRAVLEAPPGARDLALRLVPEGRYFGGNWALEVSPAEPVLPPIEHALSARGRGVVRQHGVRFRARGADPGARRLAELLSADERLGDALGRVDFEALAVQPEGRPAIRHLGGSVVWMLVPPLVRATPLPPGQAAAIVAAIDAFAAAGKTALSSA